MAADYTNEELTAFLDGEAPADRAAAITSAAASDPTLAARLDGLQFDQASLKSQADALMSSMPADILPAPRRTLAWGPTAAVAAALAAGLAIGVTLSNRSAEHPGWMQYVAAYQALYVEGTLKTAAASPADLTRLSQLLGRDLSAAETVPDLSYKRAQQLGFRGQPLVQIAYLTDAGTPMALCIIKQPGDVSPISAGSMEGMETASWSDGEFAYLLIGGIDRALIQRSAAHFREQL